MTESKETTIQYLPHSPFPLISYGLPFPEATAKHLTTTLNCKKAFLIVSGSLSRNTDALTRLESALGDKIVGIRKGMQPHTLLSEVLEVTEQFMTSGADCLITLGGGSLVDAAKIVEFATSNNLSTLETLLPSMVKSMQYTKYGGATPPPWQEHFSQTEIKIICITTTLSGGEYNPVGGGTDPNTLHKQLTYDPSSIGPSLIIWDPELTKTTPLRIWLGTGLRGIDHCVEAFTSGPNVKSEAKEAIIESVKLLLPSLLRTKEVPDDLEARLLAQKGGMLSMKSLIAYGVPVGASHGIGHQLGPLGVPHGETSAIMMPAVAKFNKKAVQAQQEELLETAFWSEESVTRLLEGKGLKKGEADLGDVMDAVIRALDLPRSLKEFGVGRDRFLQIAESSVKDRCCWSNPIPLRDPKLVMEILERVIVD